MSLDGGDIASIITAATALVGTAGGLIISYRTLQRSYWQDKSRIKVEGAPAIISGVKGEQFTVKVANVGSKDYTVTMIAVKLGRHSGHLVIPIPIGTVKVPYILEPGKTCDFWTPLEELKKQARKMTNRKRINFRAEVRDYVGDRFISKPYQIVLKETRYDRLKSALSRFKRAFVKVLLP